LAVVASVSLGVAIAGHFGGGHGGSYEGGHGGVDISNHVGNHAAIGSDDGGNYGHEEQYAPQPYKFGYRVNEEWGQQHREEQADGHGNVVGSYGFTDAHGIYRQVNYIADKFGFRAQIKTNEPGTAPSAPADAHIDSHAHQHVPHHAPAAQSGRHGHYEEVDEGHHGIRA
ncbi:cuticle protein 14-like, partial [Tropilaelaps mercedesae]